MVAAPRSTPPGSTSQCRRGPAVNALTSRATHRTAERGCAAGRDPRLQPHHPPGELGLANGCRTRWWCSSPSSTGRGTDRGRATTATAQTDEDIGRIDQQRPGPGQRPARRHHEVDEDGEHEARRQHAERADHRRAAAPPLPDRREPQHSGDDRQDPETRPSTSDEQAGGEQRQPGRREQRGEGDGVSGVRCRRARAACDRRSGEGVRERDIRATTSTPWIAPDRRDDVTPGLSHSASTERLRASRRISRPSPDAPRSALFLRSISPSTKE